MQKLNLADFQGQASAKRIGFFVLSLVVLTSVFWSMSRFPQLDQKQLMGDRSQISALAFDPVIVTTPDDGLAVRVFAGTVNWYVTNYKGMTFGLLLAGTFLSILVMVSFTSSRSILVNTLAGLLIGAPLGICTNCVAPVSKSLDDGGSRLETTLATLFSSPTMNIVVVTMLFTMFPLPIALLKMGLTLLLILAAVPLLTRFVFIRENEGREVGAVSCSLAGAPLVETWTQSLKGAAVVWGKCFWFIVKTAVPFMLLAGLLGAAAIEIVPVDALSSLDFTWWGAVVVAALGTFLPVPITFDVILASVLMGAGLHTGYVLILLFTLGPFSIYPFLLLGKSISLRVVTASYGTVMALGIVGGLSIHAYNVLQKSQIVGASGQRDRLGIVHETCGAFPSDGSECETYSLAGVAALSPEPSTAPCEAMSLLGDGSECRERDEGRRLLSDAQARIEGIQGCLRLAAEPERRACLLQKTHAIVTYLATTNVDGGARPHDNNLAFTFLYLQNDCRDIACADAQTLFRAHYVQDVGLCEDLGAYDLRQYCRTQASLWVAKQTKDLESCFSEAIHDKALCVATTPGPSVPERLAACVRLGADDATERCEVWTLDDKGVLDHPDICSALRSPKGKEYCPIAVDQLSMMKAAAQPGILARIARRIIRATQRPADVGSLFAASGAGSTPEYSDEPSRPIIAVPFLEQDGISVTYSDFFRSAAPLDGQPEAHETLFQSVLTSAVGIETPLPFLATGTTAAGDFDGDGWVDVLISDATGLHLYRNLGSLQFAKAPLHYDPAFLFRYGIVGFVDIDNDGDLDISHAANNRLIFIMNNGGGFEDAPVLSVGPFKEDPRATPFADVDLDGRLDVVLAFRGQASANRLLLNKSMTFEESPKYVDKHHGRTWGALLSDVNSDGYMDLFIGNDFEKSDEIFFGTDGGGLTRVTRSSGVFSGVSTFNMGYESADINNDLKLDVFSTEAVMVEGVTPGENCADPSWTEDFRSACAEYFKKYIPIMRAGRIRRCQELNIWIFRENCGVLMIRGLARSMKDPSVCDALPASPAYLRQVCRDESLRTEATQHPAHFEDDLRQFHRNALHVQQADGTFAEMAVEYGVAESHWAWNARIHDYDNDGWQDIYVVNGRWEDDTFLGGGETPNVFYKNIGGTKFEDWSERYGLGDLFSARTYAAEDFDLDGDIDILTQAIRSPFRLYVNGSAGRPNANAIEFRVIDRRMNSFGIGTQIVIRHDGGAQLREIKSMGGFQSHNAPVVHFGLGPSSDVHRVEIRWTDGTSSVLEGEFTANRRYTIERRRDGT